jgi:predicted transcriptional regulator
LESKDIWLQILEGVIRLQEAGVQQPTDTEIAQDLGLDMQVVLGHLEDMRALGLVKLPKHASGAPELRQVTKVVITDAGRRFVRDGYM